MQKVAVDFGDRSYDIVIEGGSLSRVGSFVRSCFGEGSLKTAIVTTEKVAGLYMDTALNSLSNEGFDVITIVVPDGEEYKTLATYESIVTELIKARFERKSVMIPLGGGVIGDVAGFVAGTLMRGVPFVQIPTTIVAQVDSSIGGKVAVDHPLGKNLIGSFYQPRGVWIDTHVLTTLEYREVVCGMAEVVKHAVIRDRGFFEFLENNLDSIMKFEASDDTMERFIAWNCRIKAAVVSADEKERLIRRLKEEHLFGVEHSPLVFKLALMNMVLHKDGSSLLQNDDSLSNKAQDVHKNKYDVILANPPFGPTKQERMAQFEYHIKLYEALFIQHMMNSLKPGGRAAVVLKEGLLFDSKKMLRKICRKMVEQFEVLGVLSLPNGVFNPYSGAKTSVVVFRRPLGRDDVRTSKVWFYQVESDGRDLGATRRPLPDFKTDGDLEHMISLWPYTWRHEKDGGVRAILKADDLKQFEGERSWWATIEDIRKTDYNLTAGRYCPHEAEAEAVEHEKPEVLINQLLDLEEEINTDLRDLLTLVTVPTSVEGLKGSVRFRTSTAE